MTRSARFRPLNGRTQLGPDAPALGVPSFSPTPPQFCAGPFCLGQLATNCIARTVLWAAVLSLVFGSAFFGGGASRADAQSQLQLLPRPVTAPSLNIGSDWLNTAGPLRLSELKGKFVLLDFWTYCCINCMHILPELKQLERAYPKELVVIGVHSAKFAAERETENIRAAVLRYGIEHPIVNDPNRVLWKRYEVDTWPSLRLIDPEGSVIAVSRGEIDFKSLDRFLSRQVAQYRRKGLVDERPLKFTLESEKAQQDGAELALASLSGLSFPGKVLADPDRNRLFIADTGHHRLVVTNLRGEMQEVIGSGEVGAADGSFTEATFHSPRGMAVDGDRLFVADTENHLIRQIDLTRRQVTTVAGTGKQRREGFVSPSAAPRAIELASPWDVLIHDKHLYIAMAGTHQIWRLELTANGVGRIGAFAGNAKEDIVDGPLLPRTPLKARYSSFAQPSGLATDGKWLFVADSEGSSIRGVAFDGSRVLTVVGTAHLPSNRLFTFGDRDGNAKSALLQHPIGVAQVPGALFVADTYNNKIRKIDLSDLTVSTLAGDGEPGSSDRPARFDEPEGISAAGDQLYVADTNNHAIRVIETATGEVSTLEITGLQAPTPPSSWLIYDPGGTQSLPVSAVAAVDGQLQLSFPIRVAAGYKLDDFAPLLVQIQTERPGALAADSVNRTLTAKVRDGQAMLKIPLTAPDARPQSREAARPQSREAARQSVRILTNYFYCRVGTTGFCATGAAAWEGRLDISPTAPQDTLVLPIAVK